MFRDGIGTINLDKMKKRKGGIFFFGWRESLIKDAEHVALSCVDGERPYIYWRKPAVYGDDDFLSCCSIAVL